MRAVTATETRGLFWRAYLATTPASQAATKGPILFRGLMFGLLYVSIVCLCNMQ